MIPYGRQSIGEEEIAAVVEVMQSDYLTQGPRIPTFEANLANFCQAPEAVAVANGTAALHLSCLALGLGPGDLLWTSANTFVASANCGLYCGARVDFIDIDPKTRNLSVSALEDKLRHARANGLPLPKILVAVHFAGLSCDMQALANLAAEYQFKIIEDASHAIGGNYRGQPIGSCQYSEATVFSFHPVKNMTAGEGGAISCKEPELAKALRRLRHHGIVRDEADFSSLSDTCCFSEPAYYEQQALGFNYRLTDIQAAIAEVQLRRLPDFVFARRQQVERYQQAFAGLPLITGECIATQLADTAWHLYVIEMEGRAQRQQLFSALQQEDIDCSLHYRPVYLQPYYRNLGFAPGYCPNAERYAERALSLPLYVDMTLADQEKVISAVIQALDSQALNCKASGEGRRCG